jgi:3-dehydroquinate synthase
VENLTHYKRYLHGEAVSIGICMANDLSVKLGYLSEDESQRIKELLQKYDLPTAYKIGDVEDFYEHFFLDKKADNKKIKFILAKGLGSHIMTDDIEKSFVLDTLKEYLI